MSFLLGDLKGCFGEEFADLLLRGVGVPPVPRLGDPCEDPGVNKWPWVGCWFGRWGARWVAGSSFVFELRRIRRAVEKYLEWSKGLNSGRRLSSLILLAFYFLFVHAITH